MKSISLYQPWATWIANPQKFIAIKVKPKRIENRSRDFTYGYRGPILIHASRTFDKDAIDYVFGRPPHPEAFFPTEKKDYPLGFIVGRAQLIKVVTENDPEADDPWFKGPYGLLLANAEPIEPIAYPGSLGLFEIPDSFLAEHGLPR